MKKQIDFRIVSLVFSVLVVCFAIVFYVVAQWTEPGVAPPGGNVDAPLNVGSTDQWKAGRLGIGINPDEKLDVSGSIRIRGWDAVLHSYDTSGRYFDLIGSYQGWDADAVYIAGYNAKNRPGERATKRVIFGGSGSQTMTVDIETGNVGIGTTGPGVKLDVVGDVGGVSIQATGDICTDQDGGVCLSAGAGGGSLSCHTVVKSGRRDVKVYCDYGVRTGGGCYMGTKGKGYKQGGWPIEPNGWWCHAPANREIYKASVVCCEIR